MPAPNKLKPHGRMREVEMLRGFALLAVVASHVFNLPLTNLTTHSGILFINIFRAALNYCVPAFILLSSLLAAHNEAEHPTALGTFYKKKLLRLVLPYLAWTLFYIFFRLANHYNMNRASLLELSNWFDWILKGESYTHLHYMSVILQFFILFPLLFRLARLVKDKPFWAFFIIIGGQNIVYWLNKLWLHKTAPYFQSSFFWNFSIAFFGLYLGLNYDKACKWLEKNVKWVISLCLVFGAVFLYYNYLVYEKIPHHTYPYYLIRLVFVICLPLCFFVWALRHQASNGFAAKSLQWIGRYSFGIYLSHPVLTYYLRDYVKTDNFVLLMLICVAAVFAFTVICGFLTKFFEVFRLTSWGVGTKASRR